MTHVDKLFHQEDARTQYMPAPDHESNNALEECWQDCFHERQEVKYIHVGNNKGRYELSTRGNYHFVGPNQGHFEREEMPVDTPIWKRWCGLICCLFTTLLLCWLVWHWCAGTMLYDCNEGTEDDWGPMKKHYCCEKLGISCDTSKLNDRYSKIPEIAKPPPKWLDSWMGDVSIGSKFLLTMIGLTCLGSCCGAWIAHRFIQAVVPPKRSPTESEILKEMEKSCHRCGAHSGEISVTLMWDTKDDLDLLLVLPNNNGTISAENPECCGGILDVDGNISMQRPYCRPIEHIYFPHYTVPQIEAVSEFDRIDVQGKGVITKDDWVHHKNRSPPPARMAPPSGKYEVLVQARGRTDYMQNVNFTVAVTVLGNRDVYHHRMVPGLTEVQVCTFRYEKPTRPDFSRRSSEDRIERDRRGTRPIANALDSRGSVGSFR